MHAMMEPEQILEHARAAQAAGAHRFCMVTQGQGLSRRDFEKVLEGARLVAEHTNLKRCVSVGHLSADRARALKAAGVQRVHHNVETAHSYYPEVTTTVRYDGRLRTIEAVREAGLETCVGGILNLGESRAQRVEMAFDLARIDPTSVPSTCSIPAPARSSASESCWTRGRRSSGLRSFASSSPMPYSGCAADGWRTSGSSRRWQSRRDSTA